VAREVPTNHPQPILDVGYRSRQLSFRRRQISDWLDHEHAELRAEIESLKSEGKQHDDYFAARVSDIEQEAKHQERDALAMYGMLEGTDPRIAPMRRALAVWGLTADDIGVLSIHGTSTGANVSTTVIFIFVPNAQVPNRRRMRLASGTTSSLLSPVLQAMRFPSWRRRVYWVIPREARLHGR
jgi:hypothetical protein